MKLWIVRTIIGGKVGPWMLVEADTAAEALGKLSGNWFPEDEVTHVEIDGVIDARQ